MKNGCVVGNNCETCSVYKLVGTCSSMSIEMRDHLKAKQICKLLGCSGQSVECPGDVRCSIISKFKNFFEQELIST